MLVLGILSFFVKFYSAMLMFRYILTPQELYFNSFAKVIAKITDPLFNIFKRKKTAENRIIILLIILLFTLYSLAYALISFILLHGLPNEKSLSILGYICLGYKEMLDFLTLFFISCTLLGTLSSSYGGSFPLYFYRLGNIWVKPMKKVFPFIKSNLIILPSLVFILITYGILASLLFYLTGADHFSFTLAVASFIGILANIVKYYYYIMTARVLISWVSPNPSSLVVQIIYYTTEPLLAPLRKIIPPLGIFDITPLIAFVIIYTIREIFVSVLIRLVS